MNHQEHERSRFKKTIKRMEVGEARIQQRKIMIGEKLIKVKRWEKFIEEKMRREAMERIRKKERER